VYNEWTEQPITALDAVMGAVRKLSILIVRYIEVVDEIFAWLYWVLGEANSTIQVVGPSDHGSEWITLHRPTH
jgi:hypothetical protein